MLSDGHARRCRRPAASGHRAQRGLSLVELLVGIAVGMIVVAGVSMLAATQMIDNRRLVGEMQLQQDMRAGMDILTRELRRAGGSVNPEVFTANNATVGTNPFTIDDVSVGGAPTSTVLFNYLRADVAGGQLGYRRNGARLQTIVASMASWQDLTDPGTLAIETFTVTPRVVVLPVPAAPTPQRLPCQRLCPDGTTNCWPQVRVRDYTVALTGRSTADPAIRRTFNSTVRVRRDELIVDPNHNATICPTF